MTKQLTPQEQDTLSAYLDNALNPRDRQKLETQIQSRPEMRAALNELRQTQQLLRQTPVLHVPHNFTLTPEMAGLRTKPPRLYPVFQWAFTVASLFFVLVFAGELFAGNLSSSGSVAMAPAAETFALEEAPGEAIENPVAESEDAQRTTSDDPAEESSAGMSEMAPPAESTPTPEFMFLAAETATPTAEATYKSEPDVDVTDESLLLPEDPLAQSVPTEPDVAMDTATLDTSSPEAGSPTPSPSFWASPWRWLQVILGGVVLLSGIGLFLFRRKTML